MKLMECFGGCSLSDYGFGIGVPIIIFLIITLLVIVIWSLLKDLKSKVSTGGKDES